MGQANISEELLMQQEVIEELKTDPSFLRIVHSMMRAYAVERELKENPIVAHTIDGTPLREEAFFDDMDKSIEDARKGASRPAEDIFKEKEQWLKSTK